MLWVVFYSLRISSGRNIYGSVFHTFEYNGKVVFSTQRNQSPYVQQCYFYFANALNNVLDRSLWETPTTVELYTNNYISNRFGGLALLNFNTWNSYGYDLGHAAGVESSYASWDNLLPSIMGSYASFF